MFFTIQITTVTIHFREYNQTS